MQSYADEIPSLQYLILHFELFIVGTRTEKFS
jgi:hypothetical protein